MRSENVVQMAPALARQRQRLGGASRLDWNNSFPDGIEDLWAGPFKPAGAGTVVRLVLN
jgi:hypothetical protein